MTVLHRLFRAESLLFAAALALALLFSFKGSITAYGEGLYHLRYAQHVLMGNAPEYLAHRDPSHPLVILLSGTVFLDTLRPMLLVTASMSALTIVFIYRTLAIISRRLALWSGWIVLLSFIPFQFQNMIFNDHVFGFFFSLLCFTSVRAYMQPTPIRLYDLTVAIGWMILSRLTFWTALPLPFYILFRGIRNLPGRARLKHGIGISLVFCLIFVTNYYCRYGQYYYEGGVAPVQRQVGWQVLSGIYRFSHTLENPFSPDDGPATTAFRENLLARLRENPSYLEIIPGRTAEEISDAAFRFPLMDNFRFIYEMMFHGGATGERDVEILKEQLVAHPHIVLPILKQAFLENAFAYYRYSIGVDIPLEAHYRNFPSAYKITFMPLHQLIATDRTSAETYGVATQIQGNIGDEMMESIRLYSRADIFTLPWHVYYDVWFAFFISAASIIGYAGFMTLLVLLLAKTLSWRDPAIRLFIALNVMLWPPAMLVSAITYMTWRYHVETGSWQIAIGCLGAWFIVKAVRELVLKRL